MKLILSIEILVLGGHLTGGHEGVATLSQDLHQVVSEVATGQIQTHDGVGQSVTLIDGDIVGHTITRVQHNTYNMRPNNM